VALAQPATTDAPVEPAAQAVASQPVNLELSPAAPPVTGAAEADLRSPAVARTLAIGTTLLGYGIMASSWFADDADLSLGLILSGQAVTAVGPSVGHFYAGETTHGLVYSGIRAGALLVADIGVFVVLACDIGGGEGSNCSSATGPVLFFGGLAVAAGFGLYDWFDAGDAARRANGKRAVTSQAMFMPIVDHKRGTLGLAFGASF
jgi:hypothetical protein